MTGRERVLTAARAEFAGRGYAATAVRDITARAGVTAPTLYHHFGSKAGVYAAVVAELDAQVLEVFEAAVAGHVTVADRVVAVIEASRAIQREAPDIAQFVLSSQQDVLRNQELTVPSGLPAFALRIADGSRPRSRVVLTLIFGLARLAVVESPRQYRASTDAVIALVRGGLV